ncbi:LysR family transcriptional regulator [Burkholderia plantarii]|uniref:LysR family transcriptional regulator n=1 Tax=Burkholderia plantarii TaxID=41899 RepID=UPI00272A4FFA|nr:LysR family transcriptional regulator [Burkholderia plantarii]WLE59539.1 LysR family transcriptional regulator [Burkholderia plantarii]
MKNLSQFVNFSAVARHGSFAQAARELGLAPSSVAKSVARLEKDLGARLFHRTTRSVTLTEEGRLLYDKASLLLEQIEALDLGALRNDDEPAGILRLGTPIGYGERVVLPVLTKLRERHPALDIDLRLSDERVNLVDEGLDAVIRFGELDDSTLIARRIDEQPLVLCASPRYLARHSHIGAVRDLAKHALIAFRMPTTGRERPFEFVENGSTVVFTPDARISISHGEALVEAAVLGAGLAQVPAFFARPRFNEGSLVEVLPHCRPAPLIVNLVTPGSRVRPARLRALIDAITSDIGGSTMLSSHSS